MDNDKWGIDKKDKYFLSQNHRNDIPCCEGCWNASGSCGTPCVDCEKWKEWTDNWEAYLYLCDEFMIFKRKENINVTV